MFSHFLRAGTVTDMSKECGRDDAQYTVCIGHVAAVVPIKALYSAWLPCQGGWKAFKLVWFPPVFDTCFPSSHEQEQCQKMSQI